MNNFEFAYYFAAIVSTLVIIGVYFTNRWSKK